MIKGPIVCTFWQQSVFRGLTSFFNCPPLLEEKDKHLLSLLHSTVCVWLCVWVCVCGVCMCVWCVCVGVVCVVRVCVCVCGVWVWCACVVCVCVRVYVSVCVRVVCVCVCMRMCVCVRVMSVCVNVCVWVCVNVCVCVRVMCVCVVCGNKSTKSDFCSISIHTLCASVCRLLHSRSYGKNRVQAPFMLCCSTVFV